MLKKKVKEVKTPKEVKVEDSHDNPNFKEGVDSHGGNFKEGVKSHGE